MPDKPDAIDELIQKLRENQAALSSPGYIEIYEDIIGVIETHRPALEAGVREDRVRVKLLGTICTNRAGEKYSRYHLKLSEYGWHCHDETQFGYGLPFDTPEEAIDAAIEAEKEPTPDE